MILAATSPTIIEVVVDELCMITVTNMPEKRIGCLKVRLQGEKVTF